MSGKSVDYTFLYRGQQLCDAVIRVHDAEFIVHKNVMCNCSPYFRALFTNWSAPDRTYFDVFDVAPEIMHLIIKFAYTDVLAITDQNVQDLFIAADFYNIKAMLQLCCRFMLENLCPQNCIGVMELTRHYHSPALRRQAFLFTLRHFEEVCTSSEEFQDLSDNHLYELIESEHLNGKLEKAVLEAVLRWVAHHPEERQASMPLLLPKVLLAIGGWRLELTLTNTMEAYDVRTDGCVQVQSWTPPRAYRNSVFLNGCVYCLGGSDGGAYFNTMHRFDLATMTWHKMASMSSSQGFVSVTVLDNHIYAMGGFDGQDYLDTAERYSTESNEWVEIAPMQRKRSNASSTTLNGKIYTCGGCVGSKTLSVVEVYDPQSDQWTFIENMIFKRAGLGVIAHNGKIFAMGGCNETMHLKNVEVYDPNTDIWRMMPPMPRTLKDFGIAVLDDRLYVIGGFSDNNTNKVECFNPKNGVWSQVHDLTVLRGALSCSVIHGPPVAIKKLVLRTSPPTTEPRRWRDEDFELFMIIK